MKSFKWSLIVFFSILFLVIGFCEAREVTILYTGQTHGALYPCKCPGNPIGGLSRRASSIDKIRKEASNLILVDAGEFSAGGMLDEYSKERDIDELRTSLVMDVMGDMAYDAALIGREELKFGKRFFKKLVKRSRIPLVSTNIEYRRISPYIIKKLEGLSVGIVGATSMDARIGGKGFFKVKELLPQLEEGVRKIKGEGVDLIVLLSNLKKGEEEEIIEKIEDIDIVVSSVGKPEEKKGDDSSPIIVRSVWQGRKLGRLNIVLNEKGEIERYENELIELNESIQEDEKIAGMIADYEENVQGVLKKRPAVKLTLVFSRKCSICSIRRDLIMLKRFIPNLEIDLVEYDMEKGKNLVNEMDTMVLPIYILSDDVKKVKLPEIVRDRINIVKKRALFSPDPREGFYIINRDLIEGKLDLFVSPFCSMGITAEMTLGHLLKQSPEKVDFGLHFITVKKRDRLRAPGGPGELEEASRQACIWKHYGVKTFDYVLCRLSNLEKGEWEDCAKKNGFDSELINGCSSGDEGMGLLQRDWELAQNLNTLVSPTFPVSPTFIVNNKEILLGVDIHKLKRLFE